MKRNEIIRLYIQIKEVLTQQLNELEYGSIEVRREKDNDYIYLHTSKEGIRRTIFIGKYSEKLEDTIKGNNFIASEIKKEIKKIEKKLKSIKYIEPNLSLIIKRNIDFAKVNLSKSIYDQSVLEGISTTFVETENIIEGLKVNNMTPLDILKIINLKHSWEFVLNENIITQKTNYDILLEINRLVEEGIHYTGGMLRDVPVKIGGTSWIPEYPFKDNIKKELDIILNSKKDIISKAILLNLFVVRKQMFLDGNKRTAIIFANHYLISKGKGLLIVPAKYAEKYKELLISYYETNDNKKIFKFLLEKCYIKI